LESFFAKNKERNNKNNKTKLCLWIGLLVSRYHVSNGRNKEKTGVFPHTLQEEAQKEFLGLTATFSSNNP